LQILGELVRRPLRTARAIDRITPVYNWDASGTLLEDPVNVSSTSQKIEELGPKPTPLRAFESRRISNEDETIPCSRNEHVETLGRAHEPPMMLRGFDRATIMSTINQQFGGLINGAYQL